MEDEAAVHTEFIFIDESGDLGKYGSKYFTIVALATHDVAGISRIMKRLRERKLKKKLKELSEIKANNSNELIRKFVLGRLALADCSISAAAISKERMREDLFNRKDELYNYLCGLLFEHISLKADVVDITIDRKSGNQLLVAEFNAYIEAKIRSRMPAITVKIRHLESQASYALQVVDFVAWALNRKFSHGDSGYYDIIRPKIRNIGREEVWGEKA